MGRHVSITFLSSFCNGFAIFSIAPIIPLLMEKLEITHFEAGWLISITLVGTLLTLIPAGVLSDKLGVKRALIIAQTLLIAALAFMALTTNYAWILVLRFIIGLATGTSFVSGANYIAAWSDTETLTRNQGIFGGSFGFGIASAFLVTNPILSVNFDINLVAALVATSSLLYILKFGRERVSSVGKYPFSKFGKLMLNRKILILGATTTVFFGVMMTVGTWVTSLLSSQTLTESILLGALVMVMSGLGRTSGGLFSRYIQEEKLILQSLLVTMIGLFILSFIDILEVVFALSVLLVFVTSIVFGPVNRLAIGISSNYSGTGLGLVLFLGQIGSIIMPAIFGLILDVYASFTTAFLFLAILTAGVFSLLFYFKQAS